MSGGRTWVAILAAMVVIAGCASGAPTATTDASVLPAPSPSPVPSARPSASVAPTASATASPWTDIEAAGATRLSVSGLPDWLAIADGAAWVAVDGGIRRLSPDDATPGELIPVGGSVYLAMDVGFDSLWVGVYEPITLVRIDPTTGKVVATIPLKASGIAVEASVGAGEGAVWVPTTDGHVLKVSPKTDKVVATWDVPISAAAVRAGLGSVWVTLPTEDGLLRLDPHDGSTLSRTTIDGSPRFLAVGEGGVWTLDQEAGTVTHVDPDGKVVATIAVSDKPIDGGDIAAGGGFVWARIGTSLVAKIDPKTDTVIEQYGPPSGSGSVAADDHLLWVSAHDKSAVWHLRLD